MTLTQPDRAASFAAEAHKAQLYGLRPYTDHLNAVVEEMRMILAEPAMLFYDRNVARSGAWLHDVLEDTKTEELTLRFAFGPAVTTLVKAVTDEPGANRKERKAKTYPKIRKAGPLAVALKLADRIANVKASREEQSENRLATGLDDGTKVSGLLAMYRGEHEAFRAALYRAEDGLDAVWIRLAEALA